MSFFEYMMRNAAPVLFWTSVLVFIGGLATFLLLERGLSSPYDDGPLIDASALVGALYQALSAAAWPFTGAGLVWTLQRRRAEGGE